MSYAKTRRMLHRRQRERHEGNMLNAWVRAVHKQVMGLVSSLRDLRVAVRFDAGEPR